MRVRNVAWKFCQLPSLGKIFPFSSSLKYYQMFCILLHYVVEDILVFHKRNDVDYKVHPPPLPMIVH